MNGRFEVASDNLRRFGFAALQLAAVHASEWIGKVILPEFVCEHLPSHQSPRAQYSQRLSSVGSDVQLFDLPQQLVETVIVGKDVIVHAP